MRSIGVKPTMVATRILLAVACLWMVAGCERPQEIPLAPRMVRAPSDQQMERLAVYSAFLARQVPKTKWPRTGWRMEGLLFRKPISYRGYELGLVQKYVFSDNQFLVQAGLGSVDRSYELAEDTLKNFYVEGARTDDVFGYGEFTGPFIVLSDEDLNLLYQVETCHRPQLCGVRLIEQELPNSGGDWSFSHIGFSADHRQALVYYRDGNRGEGGVALLEKGSGGWSVVAEAALSVS
jgi:hypothetical protein